MGIFMHKVIYSIFLKERITGLYPLLRGVKNS
jgi:hypothetical protein